jgi:hypothetical protein
MLYVFHIKLYGTRAAVCKETSVQSCVKLRKSPDRNFDEPSTAAVSSHCYVILLAVYAQKLTVDLIIGNERKPCPLEWLDSFCMRNFTNSADFDDTLPTGEGHLEASFRVKPDQFATALAAWLNQRGKGNGQPVTVEVKTESAPTANAK